MGESWYDTLFVKHPELYLPFLESEMDQARHEALALSRIFRRYNLADDAKVLDLSCGIGRHSVFLSQLGYEIVGYDPSPFFLKKAQEFSKRSFGNLNKMRFYNGNPYTAGDLLLHKSERNFDAIILMSNSFGYSNEENDIQMLKNVTKVASTKCLLLTETENRDWRLKNFQPFINFDFEKIKVLQTWSFDLETSTALGEWSFYEKSRCSNNLNHLLDIETLLRLYSLHELKNVLNIAGWKYISSYGNIHASEPVTSRSEHIITVSGTDPKLNLRKVAEMS